MPQIPMRYVLVPVGVGVGVGVGVSVGVIVGGVGEDVGEHAVITTVKAAVNIRAKP
jgi:hypothetical protein